MRGPLLGVVPFARFSPMETTIRPGEVMVLVTDGAIEARAGLPEADGSRGFYGQDRLADVIEQHASEPACVIARSIAQSVIDFGGGRLADDLAILGAPSAGDIQMSSARIVLEPVSASVPKARHFVADQLADLPRDTVDVARLLVSELVTNAVLHARTELALTIDRSDTTVNVQVADANPLLPVMRTHGTDAGTGRGLRVLERMASRWGSRTVDGGKIVWFEIRTDGRGRGSASPHNRHRPRNGHRSRPHRPPTPTTPATPTTTPTPTTPPTPTTTVEMHRVRSGTPGCLA